MLLKAISLLEIRQSLSVDQGVGSFHSSQLLIFQWRNHSPVEILRILSAVYELPALNHVMHTPLSPLRSHGWSLP